jgi:hypothetical protein
MPCDGRRLYEYQLRRGRRLRQCRVRRDRPGGVNGVMGCRMTCMRLAAGGVVILVVVMVVIEALGQGLGIECIRC